MAAKAVYNSLCLSIYITKDDLEVLISGFAVIASVFVGKTKIMSERITISYDAPARIALTRAIHLDKKALEDGVMAWIDGQLIRIEEGVKDG